MSAGDDFIRGMDVSKWQATTPSLRGVHFLIARAGIGTKTDAMYSTHIAAARAAGIITGSYWFGWGALSVSDQVNAYIAKEGNVDLHVLDWESADGFTATQARSFMSLYRQRSGNRIALYASEGRYTDLGQDWNWIANYSREPSKRYDIWQDGPYNGADGNLFRGTFSDLRALAGKDIDVTPLTITDQTPKIIAATTLTRYYDLDGATVLAERPNGYGDHVSPFGCGEFRAIYASLTTGGPLRVVLVRNIDTTKPIPTGTADDGFTKATQDAAVEKAVALTRTENDIEINTLNAELIEADAKVASLETELVESDALKRALENFLA